MKDEDIDWEKHGEYEYYDGVDRWVCNYCEKDFPLDLNTDILPHLQEDHGDILEAIDDKLAKGEILDD